MSSFLLTAGGFVLVLLLISCVGTKSVPAGERVPMQWGFDGEPTWYASKTLAVIAMPALAVLSFAVILLSGFLFSQENPNVLPALAWPVRLVGMAMIGCNVLFMILIRRHFAGHSG